MIGLLLASYLAAQTWAWDPTANATSYRVYWGASGMAWCSVNMVEYPASVCDAVDCQGEIPDPGYSMFVIVVAVNGAGEGPSEHGNVVTCP